MAEFKISKMVHHVILLLEILSTNTKSKSAPTKQLNLPIEDVLLQYCLFVDGILLLPLIVLRVYQRCTPLYVAA